MSTSEPSVFRQRHGRRERPKREMSIRAKRAKLEQLGYRTRHLSSAEVDEVLRAVEREQASGDWRSKL